jgi:hypothetical protein
MEERPGPKLNEENDCETKVLKELTPVCVAISLTPYEIIELSVLLSSEVEEDNKRLILVDKELRPGPDATEEAH